MDTWSLDLKGGRLTPECSVLLSSSRCLCCCGGDSNEQISLTKS